MLLPFRRFISAKTRDLLGPGWRRGILTLSFLLSVTTAAFALATPEMAIPCRRPRKFRPTVWTDSFHCAAALLALVAEEIAEGRKLPTIAPVVETLGFGPCCQDSEPFWCGFKGRRGWWK